MHSEAVQGEGSVRVDQTDRLEGRGGRENSDADAARGAGAAFVTSAASRIAVAVVIACGMGRINARCHMMVITEDASRSIMRMRMHVDRCLVVGALATTQHGCCSYSLERQCHRQKPEQGESPNTSHSNSLNQISERGYPTGLDGWTSTCGVTPDRLFFGFGAQVRTRRTGSR